MVHHRKSSRCVHNIIPNFWKGVNYANQHVGMMEETLGLDGGMEVEDALISAPQQE